MHLAKQFVTVTQNIQLQRDMPRGKCWIWFLLTGTADVAPCGILNAAWFAFRVRWTALNQTVTDNIAYLCNSNVKSDLCYRLAKTEFSLQWMTVITISTNLRNLTEHVFLHLTLQMVFVDASCHRGRFCPLMWFCSVSPGTSHFTREIILSPTELMEAYSSQV